MVPYWSTRGNKQLNKIGKLIGVANTKGIIKRYLKKVKTQPEKLSKFHSVKKQENGFGDGHSKQKYSSTKEDENW